MRTIQDICEDLEDGRLLLEAARELILGLSILEDHESLEPVFRSFIKKRYDLEIAQRYVLTLVSLGQFSLARELMLIIRERDPQTSLEDLEAVLSTAKNLFPSIQGLSLLKAAAREVSLIIGEPEEVVLPKLKPELPVKKEWIEKAPDASDERALRNFYATSRAFIYDLMYSGTNLTSFLLLDHIGQVLKGFAAKHVLDYGGGVGTLALYLMASGFKVTYADLAGTLLNFSRERFKNRGMTIQIIHLDELEQGDCSAQYDAITCFEVFEHIPDPLQSVRIMHRLLKPGGHLLISESCLADSNYATHLPENRKYGGDNFIPSIEPLGFTCIATKHDGSFKVFRRS